MPERIVVDTNVIVSATLKKHSTPRKVINHIYSHSILLISPETVKEIEEVLLRPKLDKYVHVQDRIYFFRRLIVMAVEIETTSRITDCPDAKDNKFLELAIDGRATLIISGDGDLLDMNPYRGINIISPSEFIEAHSE
ncbi:MAG: putative toxin-antitoxin system toxin component, PIN family [bacterium]